MALNSLLVPLRNYTLTHSLTHTTFVMPFVYILAAPIFVLQRLQRLGRCVCIITLSNSITRSERVKPGNRSWPAILYPATQRVGILTIE